MKDYTSYKSNEVSEQKLHDFIEKHESFILTEVKDKNLTVQKIERVVENLGMRCRVSRSIGGQLTAAGASAILTGGVGLIAYCLVKGVHVLGTLRPDYHIIRDFYGSNIVVDYCKQSQKLRLKG